MQRAVILAGPNGAGKSTFAEGALLPTVRELDYVNADTIALGLSRYNPWHARERARQVQDAWLDHLVDLPGDFAFETTLASKRWTRLIANAQASGFRVHLIFLWIDSVDTCLARVGGRVADGGHGVPNDVIRGRYVAGLRNLISLYLPVVDVWQIFENSSEPRIIAEGSRSATKIWDRDAFSRIEEALNDE